MVGRICRGEPVHQIWTYATFSSWVRCTHRTGEQQRLTRPLSRVYTRATCCADEQHIAGNKQHVARNMLQACVNMLLVYRHQNCCQFVARLLLDTKGYKSTVLPGNMLPWCKRGFMDQWTWINKPPLATCRHTDCSTLAAVDNNLQTNKLKVLYQRPVQWLFLFCGRRIRACWRGVVDYGSRRAADTAVAYSAFSSLYRRLVLLTAVKSAQCFDVSLSPSPHPICMFVCFVSLEHVWRQLYMSLACAHRSTGSHSPVFPRSTSAADRPRLL